MFSLSCLSSETVLSEFAGLLNKQAPLQAYIEWIDSIIERCVLKVNRFSLACANLDFQEIALNSGPKLHIFTIIVIFKAYLAFLG